MGPITAFFTALVGSAVLSRPKLPELEPKPKPSSSKDQLIAALKNRVHVLEEERDRVRSAHNGLLRLFADEQAMRLQLERDLIELGARAARVESKRSQAPAHLPLPPAPLTEGQQPFGPQRFLGAPTRETFGAPVVDTGHSHQVTQLRAQMDQVMRDMDGWICNCAPGRHEALLGDAMLGRRIFGE